MLKIFKIPLVSFSTESAAESTTDWMCVFFTDNFSINWKALLKVRMFSVNPFDVFRVVLELIDQFRIRGCSYPNLRKTWLSGHPQLLNAWKLNAWNWPHCDLKTSPNTTKPTLTTKLTLKLCSTTIPLLLYHFCCFYHTLPLDGISK